MTKKNNNVLADIFAGYKGGDEMPLAGYATLLGIYNAAFLIMLLWLKDKKDVEQNSNFGFGDFLLLSATTFKLSRLISRDRVTSPLRAPFMEYIEPAGENEVKEKVRGRGLQRAVGDLLHCPFCLSPWVAAALGFGFVFKPQATRFITKVFAASTLADVFQQAYEVLKDNEKNTRD
ncbi:MAG: DUF1360 domain-containing protein [Pyrinomonadaceae bacterium]